MIKQFIVNVTIKDDFLTYAYFFVSYEKVPFNVYLVTYLNQESLI